MGYTYEGLPVTADGRGRVNLNKWIAGGTLLLVHQEPNGDIIVRPAVVRAVSDLAVTPQQTDPTQPVAPTTPVGTSHD